MSALAALLALLALALPTTAVEDPRPVLEERVVAGGPGDFLVARHVTLRGSDVEIGRALATLARGRHGFRPEPAADARRTRAQRRYFARYFPQHLERMRGVAEVFEANVDEDAWELASLPFGFVKPGCSVVYYPPGVTALGKGVLSRNFDFTTGTFQGRIPETDEVSICAAPYVLELHPEGGHASLSICAYDLLGGVVDGINSAGLTIALLADDELTQRFDMQPASGPQAGFGVVQVGRYLLETCATVEEARDALLEAKLYFTSIPCHYIVADAHGKGFVWENSRSLTEGFVIEAQGEPLITTNFLHHLHPDSNDLPSESHPQGSFNRFRAIQERIADRAELDLDAIRAANACVAANGSAPSPPWAPGRTLWHALYVPQDRSLEVDFYLGEENGEQRRSGTLRFELEQAAPATRSAGR